MEIVVNTPDIAHLEWAIEQRAKIQRTLLALYAFVKGCDPENSPWPMTSLVEHELCLLRSSFAAEVPHDSWPLRPV